jgi:hypothetical protein
MLVISIAIEQALSLGFLVIFVPYIFLSIILTPVNTGEVLDNVRKTEYNWSMYYKNKQKRIQNR